MFVGHEYFSNVVTDNHDKSTYQWQAVSFFMFVVIFEHALLFIKILVEYFLAGVPHSVTLGSQDRKELLKEFLHRNKSEKVEKKKKFRKELVYEGEKSLIE